MKKLMKKKVSLLGKEVSVFAIVMVAMIGLVSAALVPYLSGMVTGNVNVDSPMDIALDIEGDLVIHGGESADLTVTVENLADVEIIGLVKSIVTSEPVDKGDGSLAYVACEDFKSISVTTTSTYLSADDVQERVETGCAPQNGVVGVATEYVCGPYNLKDLNLCDDGDLEDNTVEIRYGPTPIDWAKGQEDVNDITVTFEPNALGDYELSTQVVPAN